MQRIELEFSRAEHELTVFKHWASAHPHFKETAVLAELRKHHHLCALIAYLGFSRRPDLYKHEFSLLGVFRADYVVANSQTRHFVFVEFEGGEKNSIFSLKRTNQMRDWAHQIQHGYSQIADWTWALNGFQQNIAFQNIAGFPSISTTFVLICGRDDSLDTVEKDRLRWRNDRSSINASDTLFLTYNDLIAHFEGQLDVYRDARAELTGKNS